MPGIAHDALERAAVYLGFAEPRPRPRREARARTSSERTQRGAPWTPGLFDAASSVLAAGSGSVAVSSGLDGGAGWCLAGCLAFVAVLAVAGVHHLSD